MMYHPIKFGCEKISSSADMVETVILIKWALTVTLNLKKANQSSNRTLWPMTLHHHTKFGYRRFSSWGDIIQMNIHWNSESFCVCDLDLDHNRAVQSSNKTIHLMMMYHQAKFSCKRISSSDNILKSHIMTILSLTVLEDSKPIFLKDNLAHNDAAKRFSDSENKIWTNIHWHFKILLWPLPWTQQSNFSIKHSGL